GRGRHLGGDVFAPDGRHRQGGQTFRLMLSTLLAATVTLAVTGVVVYGSIDKRQNQEFDFFSEIQRAQTPATQMPKSRRADGGLNWVTPKEDRAQLASNALVSRHVVHEQVRIRRNGRPFLQIKPYMRIVARLAPASRDYADIIPSFNPLKLYGPVAKGKGERSADTDQGFGQLRQSISDASGDALPIDDRQTLAAYEVAALIREAIEIDPAQPTVRFGIEQQLIDGLTPDYLSDTPGLFSTERPQLNVTTLVRSTDDDANAQFNLERQEVRVINPAQGDTLAKLLQRLGAARWISEGMAAKAQDVIGVTTLRSTQEVQVVLAPSLDGSPTIEPIRLTLFDEGHAHRVTVKRTPSGDFSAHLQPDQDALIRAMTGDEGFKASTSLYASVYAIALAQGLAPDQIETILRIHAYDTDYRRAVAAGDTLELFFELEANAAGTLQPATLIHTALTTGGTRRGFWRFRSQDGTVDYFNDKGQNNRRFLLRRTVRGSNVRLTSGYGMRRHPILKRLRMHAGIDWAAPTGTPIIAAGNGTVTLVRRHRAYGRMVKISHANGYETLYAHMHRFGRGIRPKARVKQGQVIGYVGSTGLSTGPHLHFEVKVNGRHMDPLKIPALRERTLDGRELKEFNRERTRLLAVLRSPPVRVAQR
ncbi:MAG: M23 family metallopeptidase, partial [Pseudomonadota bacterium]